VYDYAYASRGNVVHAYDIIQQSDTAIRSGNVTLSVTDILSIPEWFFRVNKALKIFEGYIPYEFATASAIPTIYANDLSTIYDLGASINAIKTASAFDKLITDYVTYTKSYSPLFFSLLRRRVPIRYLTLSVADRFGVGDYASAKKVIIVAVGDYAVITDSASAKGVIAVLAPDYGLMTDVSDLRNRAVAVYDIIPVADYGIAVKAEVFEVLDYIFAADNVYSNRAVVITALERLVADGTSYAKSYSPLFFTLLRRRVPVVYKTLGVLDMVAVRDGLSVAVIKKAYASDYVVSDYAGIKQVGVGAVDYVISDSAITAQVKKVLASDYIGFDSVSYIKSYSPLFFSILRRKVPIVYKTLSMLDIVAVRDSASVIPIKVVSVLDVVPAADRVDAKNIVISVSDYVVYDSASVVVRKVVSVSDFIMYDYVPSMSPSDIIYMGLYSNPRTYGLSVSETGIVYDSAAVVKKTLDVLDKVIYDKADLYLL